MLGRQAVVQRDDRMPAAQRNLAAQAVVGFQAADDEAAAMQEQQAGARRVVNGIQARGARQAVLPRTR